MSAGVLKTITSPCLGLFFRTLPSKTLGLNVYDEFDNFASKTDYIHLSDNNGKIDSNFHIQKDSSIYKHLYRNPPLNKTITLEIYSGLNELKKSYKWLNNLIYHWKILFVIIK